MPSGILLVNKVFFICFSISLGTLTLGGIWCPEFESVGSQQNLKSKHFCSLMPRLEWTKWL